MEANINKQVWRDKKRTLFGLPLSFTTYYLTDEKLIIEVGFFDKIEEEIRLYRITDVSLKRTFGERIFGLGSIHVCSADKSTPEFTIKRIKKSRNIKELLSDLVERERDRKRVTARELMEDEVNESYDHDF